MLSVTFFVFALVAAVVGFGGIAGGAGKALFVLFLVLFAASLVCSRGGEAIHQMHTSTRRRPR